MSFALLPAIALVHAQALRLGVQAQNISLSEAELVRKGSDVRLYIVRLVERQLLAIPDVIAVHEVYVSIAASGMDAMNAHAVVVDMAGQRLLCSLSRS